MLRSFSPQDFIQLPPLGEAGTLTLIEELHNAANSVGKLAPGAIASLSRVLDAHAELKKAITNRQKAGSAADPKARAADRALDDAWAAFQSWLLGWTLLPDGAHPKLADARRLYRRLFPRGLLFTTLDFMDEWTESQNRLDQMTAKRFDILVDELGGAAFFATLQKAHRAYGDALHITGQGSDPDPDVLVRRGLDETHMALREYVAQVAATVRRSDPRSVDLAARLLAPLSARAQYDNGEHDTALSLPPT
jgi:hypothetical protein